MPKKKKQHQPSYHERLYWKWYLRILVIPILLLIISIGFIWTTVQETGTPIHRDISLKGGLSAILTVDSQRSVSEVETALESQFPDASFSVSGLFDQGNRNGFIIDTDADEDALISYLESYFSMTVNPGDNYTSNFISASLSQTFFTQAMYVLAISFIFMALVVFAYFKTPIPSGAVVLSAIFDILVTVGVLNLMRFEVSIAGVGALLMIIGYSIDTDILLTNRLIKEFGENYFEKLVDAWKTGTLMSLTTLSAGVAAMILTNSEVIFQIAMILVIGLIVDYISTWFQNASILMWWVSRR